MVSSLFVKKELVYDVGVALEDLTDKDNVGNCVV